MMRAVPGKVIDTIDDYVRRELSRRRDINLDELNKHIAETCKIEFVDDGLLWELIVQARKNIGFVYLEMEEE